MVSEGADGGKSADDYILSTCTEDVFHFGELLLVLLNAAYGFIDEAYGIVDILLLFGACAFSPVIEIDNF